MTVDVPRVRSSATVLETARVMNEAEATGVVVFDGNKPVGMVSDRRFLREFLEMNEKPSDVKISEVMGPFYRVEPNATLKEATRSILDHGVTRLGVFDGEKFLGWITLSDLAKEFTRKSLTDLLRKSDEPHPTEWLCPNCQKAFMEKITSVEGTVLRWECQKCHHIL
jgi:predicted transcriptional regulator/ribosomal protein S27AE